MSKIPTAEEFWKEISPNEKLGMLADLKKHHLNKHVFEAMRRYAKLHVKEAIKECIESAPSGSSTDTVSYEDVVQALKDCYPLSNIK